MSSFNILDGIQLFERVVLGALLLLQASCLMTTSSLVLLFEFLHAEEVF
jgi:hypothetical protein